MIIVTLEDIIGVIIAVGFTIYLVVSFSWYHLSNRNKKGNNINEYSKRDSKRSSNRLR